MSMIQGVKITKLSPENVLQKINEYDIFMYYMPRKDWKLNKITYSPFRNEHNPSFLIGNKNGYISFIDFGDTSKRGGCFDFIMMLFNINLYEALKMVDKDFGLGILSGAETGEYKMITKEYEQPQHIQKQYSFIQVVARKFTNEELAYWNLYHQDIEDLRRNNIYSIKKVFFNRQLFPLKDTDLRFGYLYDGHWKIYRPFGDKKSKWMPNNVPMTAMDGKENIKNAKIAFINKSKKDYMVMRKIFPFTCAVQNEGLGCFSPANVEFLKANSDVQVLSFDSDVVGVKNSQQITKLFDFEYCNVPKKYLDEDIKDWADLAKTYGMKTIEDYLIEKNIL